MRRWLKIAVPLGLAAVLLSVLAIGFGTASIDAAPGGNGKGNGHANGNGGGKVSVTITIAEGIPHFGTEVTFAVDGGDDGMWVRNECSQNGSLVYAEYNRVEGGFAGPFTLGPTPSWSGGAADCHAYALTSMAKPVKNSDFFYQAEA